MINSEMNFAGLAGPATHFFISLPHSTYFKPEVCGYIETHTHMFISIQIRKELPTYRK